MNKLSKFLSFFIIFLVYTSLHSQSATSGGNYEPLIQSNPAMQSALIALCNGDVETISQISVNAPMAAYSQTDLAQSITAVSNLISGARLFHASIVQNTDQITISLYDNLPNNGCVLLSTNSTFGDGINNFVDTCWPVANVLSGNTYYLVFTYSGNNPNLGISGDTNNPYSGCQVYANAGFGSFPNFDYTFEVFGSSPPPIPTISQWGLMVLGLIVLIFGVVAIRQRKVILG